MSHEDKHPKSWETFTKSRLADLYISSFTFCFFPLAQWKKARKSVKAASQKSHVRFFKKFISQKVIKS